MVKGGDTPLLRRAPRAGEEIAGLGPRPPIFEGWDPSKTRGHPVRLFRDGARNVAVCSALGPLRSRGSARLRRRSRLSPGFVRPAPDRCRLLRCALRPGSSAVLGLVGAPPAPVGRGRRPPRWASLRRRPGGRRRLWLAAWPSAPAGLGLALRLAVAALRASCGRPGCVPACLCASPRPRVPSWRPAAWGRSRRLFAAWPQSWPPLRPLCGLALPPPAPGLGGPLARLFRPAPGRRTRSRSRAVAAPVAPPGGRCVLLPGGGGVCGRVGWGLAAPSFRPARHVPTP